MRRNTRNFVVPHALLPLEMESFLVVSLTSHNDKFINNIQNRWNFLLSAFSIEMKNTLNRHLPTLPFHSFNHKGNIRKTFG